MSAITDAFASRTFFLHSKGVSPEQISQAERELGLLFSGEYREYLSLYGIAAFDGHELTGITSSDRLNVVSVTSKAKKRYPDLPANLYVIEELGVEELIIWQSTDGKIFGCAPNYKLEKICDSLRDYIANKLPGNVQK